jgi:hypothetical protein
MRHHALIALSAAAALVLLSGCSSSSSTVRPRSSAAATPITGPAEYGVVSRELAALEQAPIDKVYLATQEALKDLELRLIEKTKDRLNATVAARSAHHDRITVSLARVTGGVTDVKIKVGFWGDESQSRAILTEIRKRLTEQALKAEPIDPALLADEGILAAAPKASTQTKPTTLAAPKSGTLATPAAAPVKPATTMAKPASTARPTTTTPRR